MYIESIFILDFIMHFLLDYNEPVKNGGFLLIRSIKKISHRYFYGAMIWDLIPLLPL